MLAPDNAQALPHNRVPVVLAFFIDFNFLSSEKALDETLLLRKIFGCMRRDLSPVLLNNESHYLLMVIFKNVSGNIIQLLFELVMTV
jgi:hypothetical protein